MKFNPKETRYIREHIPELRRDFVKYGYTNLRIKNKKGQVQRLKLNKLQTKLEQIYSSIESQGKPIRLYLVKSRQTGSTTYWIGKFFHKTSMNSEKNLLLIAHDDEGAEGLQDKFQNYYLRSNPLLKPSVRNMNRKETYFATPLSVYAKTGDIGLDCHIDSLTAAKKSIGRSYTYNYALITEFGLFEENGVDVKSMLSSLYQAIPEEPGTAIIIETTAKGEGFAKDYWDDEGNGFVKIFISWIADDTYTVELPRDGQYFELSETKDSIYGDETEVYGQIESELLKWDVSNNLKDDLAELHHQVMCRLAWRRRTIKFKCQNDYQIFRQEYPLTVEDAFSTSAHNVFPNRITERYIETIKTSNIKPKRFGYNHDPNEDIVHRKFYKTLYGELKVYREPLANKTYVVGADGSQGIEGGDPSAFVVVSVPDLVVEATFEQIIAPVEFAGACYYISKLYNNALLGVELNDKGGYSVIQELESKYPDHNLYYEMSAKLIKGSPMRYGWITNSITRSLMISDTKNILTNRMLECYDMDLIKQMRTFVRHKNGKLAAAIGKKDDLVIALMIALQLAKNVHIQEVKTVEKNPPKLSIKGIVKELEKKQKRMLYV